MTEFAGHPTLVGLGSELGHRIIDNEQCVKELGLQLREGWDIEERAGIRERRWPAEGQFSSTMGTVAAREALLTAGIDPEEKDLPIDGLWVGTASPDYITPSTAVLINENLGLQSACRTADHNAACAGFLYGLYDATNALTLNPNMHQAMVIGTDMPSAGADPDEPRTACLFGAGAGAAVVALRPGEQSPVFAWDNHIDSSLLYIEAGGMRVAPEGPNDPRTKIKMRGREVGEKAAEKMPILAREVADAAGLYNPKTGQIEWDGIDFFAPHPGNGKLNLLLADFLGVPREKLLATVEWTGNTSSASIPLALDVARKDGRIEPGVRYTVLSPAIGGGLVAMAGLYPIELGPGDPEAEQAAVSARQAQEARRRHYLNPTEPHDPSYSAH